MSGKNSIQVAIKVRPLLRKEKDQPFLWRIVDNSIQLVDSQAEPYYFDHIFDQDANNEIIFDKMAKQIVHSAIQGFNGTIFAYGQTSSGKTYTMMGDEDNPGVMVLAAKEIFKEIERTQDRQFLLRVGYIEIYNEKIYDLLNKKNQDLKIHESNTGIVSVNCEEIIIRSEDDLLNHLDKGGKERTVGETNMNERSSRSHAIFRIIIESRKIERSEDDAVIQSVINLVDLAGSERADQTGARGTRLKEGGHINKSLLFLSNVIKRLSENEEDKYISFRDSKLTRILQASLGGNALTAIICTIKPNALEETQSTLSFALRAKAIKNKPQVNEIVSDATMMKRLEHEIKVLKLRLEEEQRKNESQIKVRQLEQRIKDEDLKIISCNSLHSKRNREMRRRTWCPSSTNLDASAVGQQPSALPVPTMGSSSRMQLPKIGYKTPLITIRSQTEFSPAQQICSDLPPADSLPEIDEEFAPAELVNFDMLSPLKTPRDNKLQIPSKVSITPKLIDCTRSTLEKVEHDLLELQSFTNLENKVEVQHEPDLALKQKVEILTQRNAVLENERLEYLQLKNDLEMTTENLNGAQKRCDELQVELGKLKNANKTADEKIAKYEAELAELKKTNEKLEMENREAVNLEFEFKRHKNKSKLRENELLEALTDKEKQITKLEKSLNALSAERLQNTKEELLQKSLNEGSEVDKDGKVCIKCEDLQRLLDENKKITVEFEKLTLECEKLKLNYIEIEKENESNKLQIIQLEKLNAKEKAESEKLLLDVQQLKEKLQTVQRDYDLLSSENSLKQEECLELNRQVEVAKKDMVVLEEKFTKLELSWQEQQQTIKDIENQYATIQTKYENLQIKYEELETTKDQSSTDCQRLEKENLDLQTEIEDLKKKVNDAQQKLLENNAICEKTAKETETANEEYSTKASKVQQENEQLKIQLLEVQTQFEDLQRECDDLSNQLMDNIQDCDYFKNENSKLKEKLKDYEVSHMKMTKAEGDIKELESQLNIELLSEQKILKTPSQIRNSSMRSSGVCVEEEEDFVPSPESQDLLAKFCELSESLSEIELEHTKGRAKLFKSASKNSTPNSYKMYLKNIMGVHKAQKQFEMEMENIHLQGSFKHHSFHIVEVSDENHCCETDFNMLNTNGCANMEEYIEKLKEEIKELKTFNEQERLSNKSLLESTERALSEMREQINQLSAELLEKSMFVENCSCKIYQQQIEILEKEKADMTLVFEGLQDIVNTTLNGSCNMPMNNNTSIAAEIKTVMDGKLTEIEALKLREKELIESYDAQTKTLEEMTQRCIDMEAELETALEQLKIQEREFKERHDQLQLEILQKLELSANEYRDNMKKYNKEWEEKRDEYEQTIEDLQNQIAVLKQTPIKTKDFKNLIKQDNFDFEEDQNCIPELHNKNQQLSDEVERLTKEYSVLQDELQKAKLKIHELCTDNTTSRAEIINQSLQTKADSTALFENEQQSLANDFENLKQEHTQLQDKLQQAEVQIKEFSQEEAKHKELLQNLQTKLSNMTALENENAKKEADFENLKQEYTKLREKLQNAEEQTQELCREQASREELTQTLQTKLSNMKKKEEEKRNLETNFENLKQEYTKLREKLQNAEEQIQAFCREQASRKELIQTLQTKLSDMTALEEEKRNLETNFENLKQKYVKLQEKLQNAEEQTQELCREQASHEELIQTLQTKLSDMTALEEEKRNLETNFENLKKEYVLKQHQLHSAEEKIKEFCLEVASSKKVVETLQNKVCDVNALEEKNKSLEIESERLKKSLSDLQEKEAETAKEFEILKQENESLNDKVCELINNETKLQSEKLQLEEKLRTISSEYSLLETDKILLENQLSSLTEETKQLIEECSVLQQEKTTLTEQLKCLKEKEKTEELLEQMINEKAELAQNLRLVTEKLEVSQNKLKENENQMAHDKEKKLQIEQDLQSIKESLTQTIEVKHNKLEELESEIKKIKQDNINLNQDLQALRQSNAKTVEEKHELQQKTEEFKRQLVKLELEKQENQLTLEKANQEYNKLQHELKIFKEALLRVQEEKQQDFNNLERSYQNAQQQNKELQEKLKDLNADLITFKENQQKTIKENTQLQTELQATKESLAKLNEEKQNLQEKLRHYQNLQEEKNKLEMNINVLKNAETGLLKNLQKEKDQLQNNLLQYKEQNEKYKEKEETFKLKIEYLSQQLYEMRGKANSCEKLLLEHEELEGILTSTTKENQKLQQKISQLTSLQEDSASQIENLTSEIEKLNLQLSKSTHEKQLLQTKLSQLKETLQGEQSSLQKEHNELKSSFEELKLKYDSMQVTNQQLENLNQQTQQQLNAAKEKLKEFNCMQEELNQLKIKHTELKLNLKTTVEEAERCSLALHEDVNHHKQLLQQQLKKYNLLKVEMQTKQDSLSRTLSANIEKLQNEKSSLEEKLRELTVRNFEQDLQRQAIDATANTSADSNNSHSPRGRKSFERLSIEKIPNLSLEEKLSAIQQKNSTTTERKNRRLSTHDERRRQSYWGVVHDKETMTDPVDTSCNCIELDQKLKECERNLFIKTSQVTALSMQLKNHPLIEETASLKKRLQEEQNKHNIEIKRYKSKLYEQTAKAEKAVAAAAHAAAKSTHAALAAELPVVEPALPKIVADAQTQTDDEVSACLQKLQGKYNDLKHICRHRYNVIKELEEKVAQKENSDGNSLSVLDSAQFKVMSNQCESLKKEMEALKQKYIFAKQVLQSRREEIANLRAQLEQAK